MTAKIIDIKAASDSDRTVDNVMAEVDVADLNEVLVVGFNKDDDLFISCSTGEVAQLNLMLDMCKADLMKHILGDFDNAR